MWNHLGWPFMKDAVNIRQRSFLSLQDSTPGEIAYMWQIMQVQIGKVWKDTNSCIFSNVFIAVIIIVCSHFSFLLLAFPTLSFGFRGVGRGVGYPLFSRKNVLFKHKVQAVSTSSTCLFYTISRLSFFGERWKYHFRAPRPCPPPPHQQTRVSGMSFQVQPFRPSWNCTPLLSLQFQFFACTGYIVTYQKITCHMGSTSSGYREKYRSAKSVGCSELSFKLVQHWRYFVRLSKTISARRSFP